MATTHPNQVKPNSQYDRDSAPNQSYNCRPTSVTNIVQFHRDTDFGIEATRNLATSRNYTGTNTSMGKIMLDRRGVPSSIRYLTASQVKGLLNGKRSIDLSLLMSKIPLSIRVRPFPGSHSVTAIAKGTLKGEPGIWVDNPDFHRDRGQKNRYFYPDRYWIPAFYALGRNWLGKTGGWALVPDREKVITSRVSYRKSCHLTAGVNARSGPSTKHTIVRVLPAGTPFTSIQLEKAGGAYSAGGTTRRDWLSFSLSGRLVWVARGFVREV